MATPMALGPFMFHALRFGYSGLSRDLSTRWASVAVAGGLDRLQWTGGDDEAVLIEGVSFPQEFGGLGTLEGLRGAAKAGLVLPLVTLAGNVHGLFVIEGVSEDQSFHDALGLPRKNVWRLRLKFDPAGLAQAPALSIVRTLFG